MPWPMAGLVEISWVSCPPDDAIDSVTLFPPPMRQWKRRRRRRQRWRMRERTGREGSLWRTLSSSPPVQLDDRDKDGKQSLPCHLSSSQTCVCVDPCPVFHYKSYFMMRRKTTQQWKLSWRLSCVALAAQAPRLASQLRSWQFRSRNCSTMWNREWKKHEKLDDINEPPVGIWEQLRRTQCHRTTQPSLKPRGTLRMGYQINRGSLPLNSLRVWSCA